MTTKSIQRLRLAVVALLLTFMVFAQSAGNTVADTKIDLVVDPGRFLTRALQLWDPIGNGGQLQNQAYGYLFPMGPFFAFGHWIGLAPWVIQRSFETAIVLGCFLGVVRLSRLMGIPGFWPRVAAGLVYALAPRTLSELTSISSELMPVAALPWVLIPLVSGSRAGSTRRAAMRSGVALLFAGGVNAAATLAIFPAPILWLLTRPSGPRKRRLSLWWGFAALLACTWWLVPLVQLGRYSPPFLNWIESASATTVPTSLQASLRGADQWIAYLGPGTWPGGWILAAAPLVILATVAVAATGLAGLARRDVRHRRFLLSLLAVGLIGLTFGHAAPIGPPGADEGQRLLDGLLVAFRNVHKFDPLVRLPLAIGFGHVLARSRMPRRLALGRRGVELPLRTLAVGLVVAIGLIAVTPALTGQLATKPRVTTEPGWWRQTASWLAANERQGRALVVPGSASPTYLWGSTVDDALQPVATTPWALRNAVPLAPAAYIRLLDRIEDSLGAGRADPTLVPLLQRSGISSVILRNDLSSTASQATSLSLVRATLDGSAGLQLAAQFGPEVSGSDRPANLIDAGLGDLRPSVQIYRVLDPGVVQALSPQSSVVAANGSADDLPTLIAAGLPESRPIIFDSDAKAGASLAAQRILTDGIRRRQAEFGSLIESSTTMDADAPYVGRRAAYDYLPPAPGPLSAWTYTGVTNVQVSSSGADLLAFLNRSASHGAWSALDQDPSTAWESGSLGGATGQWFQVRLPSAIPAGALTVSFAAGLGDWPTQVLVSTDAGSRYVSVRPGPQPQLLPMPAGATSRIRVTVTAMASGGRGGSVGIASLQIPGVTPTRSLAVGGTANPDDIVFGTDTGYRAGCLTVDDQPACDPTFARGGEEDQALDRSFSLGSQRDYAVAATVRLRPGAALDSLLDRDSEVKVTASSVEADDPRVRPGAVLDGNPDTTWAAAPGDERPQLLLRLPRVATIRGLSIITNATAPVARPQQVSVVAGTEHWTGLLPTDGEITLAHPAQASAVRVTILTSSLRTTTSSQTFRTSLLPPGISQVTIDSSNPSPVKKTAPLEIGCPDGPLLELDGTPVQMRVQATVSQALSGAVVAATACETKPLSLGTGRHTVAVASTALTTPISLHLSAPGETLGVAPAAGTFALRHWGSTSRSVRVDADQASVFAVRENFNAGWRASLDGHSLSSVQLDGWQQGFVLPADAHGMLRLTFGPQRAFVVGLLVGLVAVLVLVLLALWPSADGLDDPASSSAAYPDLRVPARVSVGMAAVTLLALAGPAGPATLLVLGVTATVLWSWSRGIPSWFVPLTLMVGAVVVASVPSVRLFVEANDDLTQLLCVAALAAAFVGDGSLRPKRLP